MNYNELTQAADEGSRQARISGIDPQLLKQQPSAKVANSTEQSLKKILQNSFRSIFKIGRKKVEGVQYLVVAIAPPEIPISDDSLVFQGVYSKDGLCYLCYQPESGDWEKANSSDKI